VAAASSSVPYGEGGISVADRPEPTRRRSEASMMGVGMDDAEDVAGAICVV